MRQTGQGTERQSRGQSSRLAIYLFIWFVVLVGWWLLLVDSLFYAEILAGLAAAVLAVLVVLGVRRHSAARFRPRLRWLLWLIPIPAGVLRDSAVLAAVLWRRLARGEHPQSAFRAVRFPAWADDPESAAWRAFSTAATSLTPNTYVIGIDQERRTILVHQLVPDSPQRLQQVLVGTEPS